MLTLMLVFLVGATVGCAAGVLLMALAVVADHADRDPERCP